MKLMPLMLTALAMLPRPVLAQAPHGLLEADANKDGAVSRAEFIAMNAARFERMDTDHDGRLTFAERIPERAPNKLPPLDPNAPWRPGSADANGDRLITRDEFMFNVGVIFSRYDSNHDDQVAGARNRPGSAHATLSGGPD